MGRMGRSQQILGLVGWLAATAAAAGLGSVATQRSGEFYAQLTSPDWAPPGEVFGPVWTVLYLLMAISAWLVWRIAGFAHARTALALYVVQLVFNALWSWLFFAWQMGAAALADIVLLWVLIVATIVAFWRHHRLAAVLLVPYLLWVGFATALNHAMWSLNPAVLG